MKRIGKRWGKVFDGLRANSRKPLTELSRETGLPVSSLHDRIKKWREEHTFHYTMLANFKELGAGVWAFVGLKAVNDMVNGLTGYLKTHPNVNNAFQDGNTFMVEVVFKSEDELFAFFEELEQNYHVSGAHLWRVGRPLKREACSVACMDAGTPKRAAVRR